MGTYDYLIHEFIVKKEQIFETNVNCDEKLASKSFDDKENIFLVFFLILALFAPTFL